jgi:hypothetical protein
MTFKAITTLIISLIFSCCTQNKEGSKTSDYNKNDLESALSKTINHQVYFSKEQNSAEIIKSYKKFNKLLSQSESIKIIDQAFKSIQSTGAFRKISIKLDKNLEQDKSSLNYLIQNVENNENSYMGHHYINQSKSKGEFEINIDTNQSLSSINKFFLALNHNQFFFDLERKTNGCDITVKSKSGSEKVKIALAILPSSDLLHQFNCSRNNIQSIVFLHGRIPVSDEKNHHISQSSNGRKVYIYANRGPQSIRRFIETLSCVDTKSKTSADCSKNQSLSH